MINGKRLISIYIIIVRYDLKQCITQNTKTSIINRLKKSGARSSLYIDGIINLRFKMIDEHF